MVSRLFLSLAFLGVGTNTALAQSSPLDLIPSDAALAIIIRHPEELRKKGDDFLKDTELNVGIRPTEALDFIKMFLGINQGLDLRQPSGAVLLRPKGAKANVGLEDLNQSLYIVLAATDVDAMAANFGFGKGELQLDKISKVKIKNPQFGLFILVRGKHFYLAATEAPLKRLLTTKALTTELSSAQQKSFGAAGILLHVKPEAFGGGWAGIVKMMAAELNKLSDAREKESVGQFIKTMESLRFALAGVRVGEGLGISFLTVFSQEKNEAVGPFLAGLKAQGDADLRGLPEGRVVAAQAFAGDGTKNAVFARAIVNYVLQNFLENKQITSAADRPTFLGVFDDVWQRLHGSRMAAYLSSDESKLGLFSLIAILDTEDPEKFLVEMRTLAKIADGTLDPTKNTVPSEIDIAQLIKDLSSNTYRVRASASTKLRLIGEPALTYLEKAAANPPDLETSQRAQKLLREISAVAAERRKELLANDLPRYVRPTFAFINKAETRAGLPIDIVQIKMPAKDQAGVSQMKQFFGLDWDKLRLAVHGKQVVVLLGSEVSLFEATLANLKEGKAGLAGSKMTEGIAKMQTPKATATFHLSAGTLIGLVSAQSRRLEVNRLSSFALSVQDAAMQLDLFVPIVDIKAIERERKR